MTSIFSGNYSESMIVKNILENENIEVFIVNESMSNIEPWAISSGGFNPVILKVHDDDFEKARNIISDYNNGRLELNT
jgi:hypothetical protein